MLQPIPASNQLALTLEEFIAEAEAFLQGHYDGENDSEEVRKMILKIQTLKYEIDEEGLQAEFDFQLSQEKKDHLADFSEHHWVA